MASGNFEEVTVEEFRCEVCKKVFKKEKQMDNHVQSKKHKDNYAIYRANVQLDDETELGVKVEEEKKQSEIDEELRVAREVKLREIESQQKKKTHKAPVVEEEEEETPHFEKEEAEEEKYMSKAKLKKLKE